MADTKTWRFADLRRFRLVALMALWAGTLGASFLTGAYAYKHRATFWSYIETIYETEFVSTSLYDVAIRKVTTPAEGEDGSIAAFENGILLADGAGRLWFVDADLKINSLAMRIPINRDAFESDPDNSMVAHKGRFSVKDILVARLSGQLLLIASHNYWDAQHNCYGLRVSYAATTNEALQGKESGATSNWETVFESSPCLDLSARSGSTDRRPTKQAGGRLIKFSGSEVLLTVGEFDGYNRGRANYPQRFDNTYGKTMLINFKTGTSRIYSIGHRNPQGLAITSDAKIWSTEHGPQGGDELNLIEDGKNYGFPYVTYGTDYGTSILPLSPRQGAHDGYVKPVFSWVPSIATSELVVVSKDLFSLWKGDLIISSLKARNLYRTRIEEGRVVLVEPLAIGHRIRDMVESSDGRLVLKTDDHLLIFIEPVDVNGVEAVEPALLGKYLASQCQGCHTFNRGETPGIGPNLYKIFGRPIASKDDFDYSPALRAVSGRWTADALRSFLKDPESFAPGTAMQMSASLTDDQISNLVRYLETLH